VILDQFDIPAVYVLSTRTGLFGPEKYVFMLNVNVLEISPDTAAVSSQPMLRTGDFVISTWEEELFDGVAVWAENLGVEAFDILGD
jgi:hypothetical protein